MKFLSNFYRYELFVFCKAVNASKKITSLLIVDEPFFKRFVACENNPEGSS